MKGNRCLSPIRCSWGRSCFAVSTRGEADGLLALVELRSFAPGEQIVAEGEIATRVLMVLSGLDVRNVLGKLAP